MPQIPLQNVAQPNGISPRMEEEGKSFKWGGKNLKKSYEIDVKLFNFIFA